MRNLRSRFLAVLMILATLATFGATLKASAQQKTFSVWYYEKADSAMGASWGDALKDFQAKYPDVKIDFQLKTFEQSQDTNLMILNSDSVPDVLEINKGNGTAGLYAKSGLLSDLTDEATKRGWDKIMSPSLQTTARYNDKGVMGTGPLYGITTYGEFVMVYYNKDLFKKYNVAVPTSLDEFNAACDAFVKAGVTPLTMGALSKWPITHNFYELALYKADRTLISNYELLQNSVDFHGEAFTFGAQALADQFKKGYYGTSATGTSYDDSTAAFVQGKYPMNLTGSWQFGNFLSNIKTFEWGLFVMPGKKLNTGSGGNLLAVPKNAKNKDLAYDYLDLALGTKAQTIMANAGGIPVNADLSKITEPHTAELNKAFSGLLQNDGLAFYPDWPAPGYMDVLTAALQDLINAKTTPAQFLDAIAGPYNDYKATLQ